MKKGVKNSLLALSFAAMVGVGEYLRPVQSSVEALKFHNVSAEEHISSQFREYSIKTEKLDNNRGVVYLTNPQGESKVIADNFRLYTKEEFELMNSDVAVSKDSPYDYKNWHTKVGLNEDNHLQLYFGNDTIGKYREVNPEGFVGSIEDRVKEFFSFQEYKHKPVRDSLSVTVSADSTIQKRNERELQKDHLREKIMKKYNDIKEKYFN